MSKVTEAMHVDRTRLHWLLTISVVCLVMGALLAVQVRSKSPNEGGIVPSRLTGNTRGGAFGELSQLLGSSQKQVKDQLAEIESLRKQLGEYEKAALKQKDLTQPLAKQLINDKLALGLSAVAGPGVALELDDSKLATDAAAAGSKDIKVFNAFLVHDTDLVQIVNEIWAAGAEAVAVNGQRIVAGTAIRCAGPTIHVNSVPIAAPFQITALGDPRTLANALKMPNGVLEQLSGVQIRVRLEEKPRLELPAIATAKQFRYAKPVDNTSAAKPVTQ